MADILKVLGQAAPGATNYDMYVVPNLTQTTTSSLIVCNRSGSARTYRVAVRPLGAEVADKHWQWYDKSLSANDTDKHVIGMTLNAGDIVTVYGSTTDVSFTLYGVETSDD